MASAERQQRNIKVDQVFSRTLMLQVLHPPVKLGRNTGSVYTIAHPWEPETEERAEGWLEERKSKLQMREPGIIFEATTLRTVHHYASPGPEFCSKV